MEIAGAAMKITTITTNSSFSFSIRPKAALATNAKEDEKSNGLKLGIGSTAATGVNATTSEDTSNTIRISAKPLIDFSQIQQKASESKKSAARQRMAQLKSQIEAMMKFSMFDVNPRLIAQLAKELKSLVAEYGDAGMSVAVPSTAGASSEAESGAEAAEAADSAVAAASGNEADDATKNPDGSEKIAGAETSAAEKKTAEEASLTAAEKTEKEEAANGAGKNESAEENAAKSTPEEAAPVAAEVAAAQAALNAANAETAEPNLTKTDGDIKSVLTNQADREFFAEAKKLAQMLKYLMSLKKPPANEKSQEAKDINAANKAIEDLGKSITKVEEAFFAPSEADSSVAAVYSGGDVQVSLGLSVFA